MTSFIWKAKRPPPLSSGGGEVASSVASALLARHASSMRLGLRWWRQEAGPTRVEVEGRPRRLPFLCFDWLGGAVKPPLRPFIREGDDEGPHSFLLQGLG